MEEMILKVKDKKKVVFLRKLLSQFDFVEIEKKKVISEHSIFNVRVAYIECAKINLYAQWPLWS